MEFTPRLKAPAKNNKYYNNTSAGGYLHNILGNYPYNAGDSRTGIPGLNVLPNCVGWVAGRWNELCGKKKLIYDLNTDAKNFLTVAKQLGLKTGKTPKVGAIIVWTNSSYGHVAVVEQVISDTEIVISESGWSYKGATGVWTATHTKGKDGNWLEGGDYSWMNGRYTFSGFIYNPDVEESTEESTTSKDVLEVDGSFGPQTTLYTQKRLHVTQDGKLGTQTIMALQHFLMMPVKQCDGVMTEATIRKFQKWLQRKAFYSGKVNGKLDEDTIKAWQTYLNKYYAAK